MAAKKGNKYWQLRKKHGRYKAYTPDGLWKEACDYFGWIDDNPFEDSKEKISTSKDNKKEDKETTRRRKPYTETGLQIYLGVTDTTWENYCSNIEPYKDFFAVTRMIKKIIYTQKFEGAAAGHFNANIIARDLGLKDRQDITTDDEKINQKEETPEELKKRLDILEKQIEKHGK